MAAKFHKLASIIAKREGKKSQARIGDIREILKILVQLEKEYLSEGLDTKKAYPILNCPSSRLFDDATLLISKEKKKKGGKK